MRIKYPPFTSEVLDCGLDKVQGMKELCLRYFWPETSEVEHALCCIT